MQKLFENWREYKKSSLNEAIAHNIEEGAAVNVVLYFHGLRTNVKKRLKELENRFLASPNTVLLIPDLTPDPQKKSIPANYIEQQLESLESPEVNTIQLYAHSAGGKPMSRFILSGPPMLDKMNAVYLDAIYGRSQAGLVSEVLDTMCGKVSIVTQPKGTPHKWTEELAKTKSDCFKKSIIKQRHNDFRIPP
mgnify:CR=1 FL=1